MTTNKRITRAAFGLAAALFGLAPLCQAGGLPPLQIAIEGLSKENQAQCDKLLREAFAELLLGGGRNTYDVTFANWATAPAVRLHVDKTPLSLADLEKALKGSPFSIKRDELQFHGVVRLQLRGVRDQDALSKRLGKECTAAIHVLAGDDQLTTVIIDDRTEKPFLSYPRLKSLLEADGATLASISWGRKAGAREPDCWHCRKPFGAWPTAATATAARAE